MATLQFYSIGKFQDSQCHKTCHKRGKVGLLQVSELTKEEIELVIWRKVINKKNLNTIGLHHQNQYLQKLTKLNQFCCDPCQHHDDKKSNKGNN